MIKFHTCLEVISTRKFIIYSEFLVLVVAFTIGISNNNTSFNNRAQPCYTNTIDLKMSTKAVNVCVNFWCKFQKAGAINTVVAKNFPSTPRIHLIICL